MTKKQIKLIAGVIVVVFIAFVISKSSTYIKSDVKVDSTEIKVDTTKVDSLEDGKK